MRQRQVFYQIGGLILVLSGCSKNLSLSGRATGNIHESAVQSPTTDSKTDRPQETGEGLPGYLIDPSKLIIQSAGGVKTVSGSSQAVRDKDGASVSTQLWLVRVAKKSAKVKIQGKNWQLDGEKIAEVQSDREGAFTLQGSFGVDDLLFVKIADSSQGQIRYQESSGAGSALWIDGTAAKSIEANQANEIATQVSAAQPAAGTVAAFVAQFKATGQCKNCDLHGADLSNLNSPNCDLSYSNIAGAKFTMSDLSSCNFSYSNLSMADFSQANLSNANMTSTDIKGAIFTGANINGIVGQQIPGP